MNKLNIIFPESVKKYVRLQVNDHFKWYAHEKIFDLMYPYLENLNPQNVLELGCGIGRGSVHFFKKFNWTDTKFYLLDGDSGNEQVSGLNPNTSEDFYNSIAATRDFCAANGLSNFELINIEKEEIPNIQFDLVYSIASIGFHWSVDLYLDRLIGKLKSGTLILLQTRPYTSKACKDWVEMEKKIIKKHPNYEIVSYDVSNNYGALAVKSL